MAVPDFQSYMTPVLHLLSDGQARKITDISALMAEHFELTVADLQDLLPSGRKSRHYDRVGWAASYMKQAGLLVSPQRAWYQITARGLEVVRANATVNVEYLSQFDEFAAFKSRSRDNAIKSDTTVNADSRVSTLTQTPDEIIEASYQILREALATELLDRLKQNSSQFFEKAVLKLLVKMGYGEELKDSAQHTGSSGDHGIDGIINQDRLGLDVVYIQAKRWQGPVGASFLRDFTGSLEANRSTKGVFITTSTFTKEARDHVGRVPKRIILIDGKKLAQLMIDFDIGVTARSAYIVKKIDEDFFSEE